MNSELNRMLEFSRILNKFKNYKFIYIIEGPGLKKNDILVSKILEETNIFLNLYRFQKFLENN
ncbi:MAG: hypothetical protein Q8830_01790 [Candidatus Phytoplasma australasiaticum]|nr:hypothetical protein [Candidatus Phytoplasma australasiaticum]MDV3192142.1 hypothetical protein [Candidatus Phytoplasma australasiaticum]